MRLPSLADLPFPRRVTAVAVLLAALVAVPAGAFGPLQQFSGRVVQVDDGDTVRVLKGRESTRVRIFGIDAPEKDQPYGAEARELTARLLLNQTVSVTMRDIDTYGRLVASLAVGGRDIGMQLVQAGAAWNYAAFSRDASLAEAERQARAAGLGLWAFARPVAPWDFRSDDRTASGIAVAAVPAPVARAVSSGAFHGNRNSKVFHGPGCQHYDCANCVVMFSSRASATAAGFRAHSTCVR